MYKIVFALIVSSVLGLPFVQAAEWSLTGRLDPSVEYDDNVFMSEKNKDSGTRYTMAPTATVTRAVENSDISVSLGYRLERWSSVDIEDTENPFAHFDSSFNTERSQYGLALSYSEDTTRETAAEDTGNFRSQSILTTKSISPSYSYQLTERDTLSLNGSYVDREYDTNAFNDNELKSLTTDWMHQYTERLSAGLSVGVYNYKADSALTSFSVEHDNYNLLALLNYQVTELWVVDGRVGMRRLESELTNDFGFKEDNSSSGTSFNINAIRQDETDTLTLGASQQLSPNSDGGVDEHQRLNVIWSRNLSDTLTASISGSYLESTSESRDFLKEERKYYNFSPSINWQFEQNLGLNLTYNYRKQKRDLLNTDATGNSVMATLIYDWDGIRASR